MKAPVGEFGGVGEDSEREEEAMREFLRQNPFVQVRGGREL